MKWNQLSERQILKAQAEGQFDRLKGAGKPLPPHDPAEGSDAVGFRIMAEAGVVPREIELRKQAAAIAEALNSATEAEERRRLTAELAEVQMRLAIEQEARRRFYGKD